MFGFWRGVRVTVVYDSGVVVRFRCKRITVRRGGAGVDRMEWEDALPNPLIVGVDHVVAVYSRKVWWRRVLTL